MNIALLRTMTVDEYLTWSAAQPEQLHSELINGQVVAMAPERAAHNRVKIAVLIGLHEAVEAAQAPCEVMMDGMTVRIDQHTAYVPDAVVYCGEKIASTAMIVPNPMIVVEVLSPTTAHSDTSAKLIGYFKLPSVAHYLVIDPEPRTVTHYSRNSTPNLMNSGKLHLDPPGLDLSVEDLLGPA